MCYSSDKIIEFLSPTFCRFVIYDLDHSKLPLPALEYLFNTNKTAQLTEVTGQTLVVMSVLFAYELAKEIKLHNHHIKNIIPMGQLTDKGIKSWSNKFGEKDPLLIFVSDLDIACEYVEEKSNLVKQVIINAKDRNATKFASLKRLQNIGIPTLVVTDEKNVDELNLNPEHYSVWEWRNRDFQSILWPINSVKNETGQLVSYERKLQRQTSAVCKVQSISLELADRTLESIFAIKKLASERGEDNLVDLDEIISLSYKIISFLLRTCTVLTPQLPSFDVINADLEQLAILRKKTNWLNEIEIKASQNAEKNLHHLFCILQTEHPKAKMVRELLEADSTLSVICPDSRIYSDLKCAYSDKEMKIFSGNNDCDKSLDGAIIPGWFRKKQITNLLTPPITSPIYLLLYDIEKRWYTNFQEAKHKARNSRILRSHRKIIFPNVQEWKQPENNNIEHQEKKYNTDHLELEIIQDYVRKGYRQHIYNTARSDDQESEILAQLFLFEGGSYAFLSSFFKANVITHLIGNTVYDTENKADLKQKPVSSIEIGDYLLFNRGSDRDVIRSTADQILPEGVRDTSSLWRKSLIDYIHREKLSSENVYEQLRNSGCPLQYQTIKNWLEDENIIAPLAYKRDVSVIVKVTGDETLANQFDNMLAAIYEVRSAHLRASHILAKKVISKALNILKEQVNTTSLVELGENLIIVRVSDKDENSMNVRASICNRVLEGNLWHE